MYFIHPTNYMQIELLRRVDFCVSKTVISLACTDLPISAHNDRHFFPRMVLYQWPWNLSEVNTTYQDWSFENFTQIRQISPHERWCSNLILKQWSSSPFHISTKNCANWMKASWWLLCLKKWLLLSFREGCRVIPDRIIMVSDCIMGILSDIHLSPLFSNSTRGVRWCVYLH